MIVSLSVKQFALFEDINLDISSGMTVFTGETGAGKSILVDAMGAIFGARANVDWVRHGAEKAEVTAEISSNNSRLLDLLEAQDIDIEDGILLRRVITREGRSRAWVNGTPTSAGLLKQIGDICFDLHGQHEHQTLMQPEFQQGIIDSRISADLKNDTKNTFVALKEINQKLKNLQNDQTETQEKAAWMREESERLRNLDIAENLEEELEQTCNIARHQEQVQTAAATALNLFDESEASVRSTLGQTIHHVDAVSSYHPSLKESHELLLQMDALASEIAPHLQQVLDSQLNIEEVELVEERLASLRAAKRRHNTDENGLLQLLSSWEDKLSHLDTATWDKEELLQQQVEFEAAFTKAAETIHHARLSTAKALIDNLKPFLQKLGLENMQLQASVVKNEDESKWSTKGWDNIELLAAANVGEPFKSLADTASGGELSRLVLALKGCGVLEHEPDTVIFDEVDVGIGGETGWSVGELLRMMGTERQVMVVSHLPQVAACAHHQVAIQKSVHNNRTHTELTPLNNDLRQQEVARMLGGINPESLTHAQQMLQRGQQSSNHV